MSVELRGMTPLLSVFNMPASLAFYRDILGFEVVSDSGSGDDSSWVWLRRGEIDLMLNDQYEPGHVPSAPLSERTEWHHDTCLYFGCPDTDAAFEYLRSKGIKANPPKDAPYGMRQIYFHDPDGYNLCFQWRIKDQK
jgi:catechol 2,3-dioxygenase-like lactoylglutathione lyase family enzyme